MCTLPPLLESYATLLLLILILHTGPLIKTLMEEIIPWLKNNIENQWCARPLFSKADLKNFPLYIIPKAFLILRDLFIIIKIAF